jgi:hypothetical protein
MLSLCHKFKHDSDDAIVEFANKIFTIDAKLTLTKGNDLNPIHSKCSY